MARLSGFQHPIRRSVKRMTSWGKGPDSLGQNAVTSQKFVWSNGVVLVAEAKATIVRIRGNALVTLSVVDIAAEGFVGALGLGVFTAEAFAAGAASMPGPLVDSDWDGWMWHSFFQVLSVANTGEGSVMQRFEIDTKAMRKLEDSQILAGVAEVTERGDGTTLALSADTRVLLKLS